MRILVTNDDSYRAKGVKVLSRMMRAFGEVTVVSPKFPQSGMGMAVSLGKEQMGAKDLGVDDDGVKWVYLDATPASCVKYALNFCYPDGKPDVVVCGINHGSNACTAACYSGTLGAAQEAALNGIPAIGVSLDAYSPDADFWAVERFFPGIFIRIMDNLPVSFGTYYNVNFPDLPSSEIKGIRASVMGIGRWIKEFVPYDPEGKGGPAPVNQEGESLWRMAGIYEDAPGNHIRADHHMVMEGYISISAHKIDTTDTAEFTRMLCSGFDRDFK